jgi:flagellar biosynthesis/type III secretory pathway M-ring protein FliF/YscJ
MVEPGGEGGHIDGSNPMRREEGVQEEIVHNRKGRHSLWAALACFALVIVAVVVVLVVLLARGKGQGTESAGEKDSLKKRKEEEGFVLSGPFYSNHQREHLGARVRRTTSVHEGIHRALARLYSTAR